VVRPKCCRKVDFEPGFLYFKPKGVPLFKIEEVFLENDELEALRLSELECLNQEMAAQKMNISQSTFNRILQQARRKIVDFIINGKSLKINGGQK